MRAETDSELDCSTIIVSYDTFELTRVAIRTALESANELRHEVIVVDNASPDESGRRLKEEFANDPRVIVIQNPDNPGFSAANNIGAASARGEIFFFLNPDTIVHGDAIPMLVDFVRSQTHAGAVGPRVLNSDGSIQHSAFEFPTPGWMVRHHLPLKSLIQGSDRRIDPVPEGIQPVDVVKGCALAIHRDRFRAVGGWDENYFMYAEETELCRALAEKGYVNYHISAAVITHLGGAATLDRYAEEQVRMARSVSFYLKRHSPVAHRVVYRATGLAGYALRAGIFSFLKWRRPEQAEAYARRRDAALALTRWFAFNDSP